MQTRDLPLLKSLKTATVAPTPLAIRCTSDKTVLGKVHSMELGIYHEFPVLPGRSQAECFAAGFEIVDASEEYGLDVMWLAELHFDKRESRRGAQWRPIGAMPDRMHTPQEIQSAVRLPRGPIHSVVAIA